MEDTAVEDRELIDKIIKIKQRLENIGKVNIVTMEETIKKDAFIALENMLNL